MADLSKVKIRVVSPTGKKGKDFNYKLTDEDRARGSVDFRIFTDLISDDAPGVEVPFPVSLNTVPVNRPPTITVNNVSSKPNVLVTVSAVIKDPDNDPLTIEWKQVSGPTVTFDEASDKFSITFTPTEEGDYVFNVKVSDPSLAVVDKNINVNIKADNPEPCPIGQHRDPVTGLCVPDEEPVVELKIGQIGDTHGNHEGFKLLKTREKCDFILHSGDVTDTEDDDDGYVDAVKEVGLTYGVDLGNSQGNHESQEEGGEGAQADMEAAFPALKENQWLQFYHVKNACIIIGNTQIPGYSQMDSVAAKHIQESLDKAKQLQEEGKADWIIFMQHKPMYTMKSGHDPEYNFRYNFHPIFDAYGVDIYLDGHVHNEQRTLPLIFGGQGTNVPPTVNNKMKDGAHDFTTLPHGTICIVNGSSTKSHSFSESLNAWTAYAESNGNAYTILEINGKNLTGKIVDIDSGNTRHQFKITKGASTVLKANIKPVNPFTSTGQVITLDGRTSTGPIVAYKWEQASGTDVGVIQNSENPLAKATVPENVSGDLVFRLIVSNDQAQTNEALVLVKNNIPDPTQLDAKFKELVGKAIPGQEFILDGSQSSGAIESWAIFQTNNPGENVPIVGLRDPVPPRAFSKAFIMPDLEVAQSLKFTLEVRNPTRIDQDTMAVIEEVTPVGEFDEFGMKMLFKPTGNKVAMERGSDHRNGQRYNVNHHFENYIHQGYYKIGQGQDKINIKGDGPNHSGCDFIGPNQECLWMEMDINLSNGKFELQNEFPHADNYNIPDSRCELIKSFGQIREGQWIGWANAYYWGADGFRHMKGFVDLNPFDANGKPLNNWQEGLYAIEKGGLVTEPQKVTIPRKIPINFDNGLEAEIRMNNATNHDTDFKNAWVIEIVPPT